TVIGKNNFDAQVAQCVVSDLTDPNADVETAIATIHATDNEVTDMIMSPAFRSALAQQRDAKRLPMFPDLASGNATTDINVLRVEVNRTVSDMAANNARAYVGDFANYFKWGYSKQIPLKVIEYGDPDNSGNDLQGYNQVYLRAEVFLGWGILDPEAFAVIVEQ